MIRIMFCLAANELPRLQLAPPGIAKATPSPAHAQGVRYIGLIAYCPWPAEPPCQRHGGPMAALAGHEHWGRSPSPVANLPRTSRPMSPLPRTNIHGLRHACHERLVRMMFCPMVNKWPCLQFAPPDIARATQSPAHKGYMELRRVCPRIWPGALLLATHPQQRSQRQERPAQQLNKGSQQPNTWIKLACAANRMSAAASPMATRAGPNTHTHTHTHTHAHYSATHLHMHAESQRFKSYRRFL